jgi:hypothetical protein
MRLWARAVRRGATPPRGRRPAHGPALQAHLDEAALDGEDANDERRWRAPWTRPRPQSRGPSASAARKAAQRFHAHRAVVMAGNALEILDELRPEDEEAAVKVEEAAAALLASSCARTRGASLLPGRRARDAPADCRGAIRPSPTRCAGWTPRPSRASTGRSRRSARRRGATRYPDGELSPDASFARPLREQLRFAPADDVARPLVRDRRRLDARAGRPAKPRAECVTASRC